jgi:multicomponent K+:H+ antiporter subunit E
VSRWLPHPLLALGLLLMWLLLNQSWSPGQIVLGAVVAVTATWAMAALQPERVRIRSWRAVLRLAGTVLADIGRSNVAVGLLVFFPGRRDRVSGFVRMPLDISNRYALTVLACVLTATPGTAWVQYDRGAGRLLVHVLDLVDEEEWIRLIKHRYERLLLEIFG